MRDHSAGHKRELIAPTVNTDSKGEFRDAIENRSISAVFLFFGRFSPEATSRRQTPLDSATRFPRVPSEISFGLKPPCGDRISTGTWMTAAFCTTSTDTRLASFRYSGDAAGQCANQSAKLHAN
jgi:hypothetical protein